MISSLAEFFADHLGIGVLVMILGCALILRAILGSFGGRKMVVVLEFVIGLFMFLGPMILTAFL